MRPLVAALCAGVVLFAVPVCAAQTVNSATEAPAPTAADVPDTLMFTIDELNEIQSRIGIGEEEGAGGVRRAPIEDATLYLSTILYYSPEDWTAWINDVPIGPRQDIISFEVTAITPNYVELLVPLSAQGMRPVRLSPNQTFIAKSGAIVEGKWKP